jgi:hypothetical protein
MEKQVLLKHRRGLQRQRDAELRACRVKWRSRIRSLDRLLRTPASSRVIKRRTRPGLARPIAVVPNALQDHMKRGRKVSVLKLVRYVLRRNQGFFTAATLADLINQTRPFSVTRRDLNQPLGSLRQLGEITLIARGGGRKPHMYMKL